MPVCCSLEANSQLRSTSGIVSTLDARIQELCEVCVPDELITVQGRLRQRVDFWRSTLLASTFICDIVEYGYKIPFVSFPVPLFQKNHRCCELNRSFVDKAVQELVESKCVQPVDQCPTVCSPLQVVTNAKGKKRLVIDLRHVNHFLLKQKFKYEGLDVATQMLEKGDFFFTFDLKSGYHHVDIHKDYW